MTGDVRVEHGEVASIVLDRPAARNALSVGMCEALTRALEEVAASDARAILLRGEGPVFCAGADLAAVAGEDAPDFVAAFESALRALESSGLPTVAMLHGAALGGGLQLAIACDFRVAGESTRLGIPAARLGVVVTLENVERLVRLTGASTAMWVLLTGDEVTSRAAVGLGLVTASVADTEVEAESRKLAATLAANAPLSVRAMRATVRALQATPSLRDEAPDLAADVDRLVEEAYRSADLQEGVRAMREKRRPSFRGL